MNAQEIWDKLEPRIRKVEHFKWWVIGISAVVVLSASTAFWRLFDANVWMHGQVHVHATKLATLEQQLADGKKVAEELKLSIDKSRRNILVLWERHKPGELKALEAVSMLGIVLRVTDKTIDLLPDDIEHPTYRFKVLELVPRQLVRIDGHWATFEQLKAGMKATVTPTGPNGEVTYIEVWTPKS